ncbi:DNA fragmentation factor subunit alpha-like [Argonauta hians]
MMSNIKHYKVWNSEHNIQKDVTAENLQDLLYKVTVEFDIGSADIKLVLEEDGTEVDDEDYFKFISSGTIFQILSQFQIWKPLPSGGNDVYDGPPGTISNELVSLLSGINSDLAKCLALSDSQLEEIANMSLVELSRLLVDSEQFATYFKEACEKELISREDNDDILYLLRMIDKHQSESVKRRKIDDTDSD